ncbi:hypothetical protein DWB61_11595 [Ancylomarina euxinus]|uniref:Uncharacterized protein n=1 Tax=Ancylomarina euxinus TaxID=2283627 RepID=A0A425XZT8_9BACT|nr:DUF6588 family protein [Ancylomarina euxinus]MCZ4695522.1 hypothetical protein [Ancylomarina euxinus]MUP15660.1 hypothetical protein [Ancylomarina euxinus]RRG20653.1 hypothetical protein DWB61_11595 [Ancylomarina euxinus]
MKKFILLLFLLIPFLGKSQDIEQFLLSGTEDASKLTENYVNPVAKGFMYGLNNGWYTTARTHKKFGFDITLVANLAQVPGKDEIFNFVASDYKNLSLQSGPSKIQTLFGGENTTVLQAKIETDGGSFDLANFNMPDGIGDDLPIKAVPSATLQVGIGIPVIDADLKIRYLPKLGTSDLETGMFGIGIQKSFSKLLKIDKTPFDVSALLAFTNLNAEYDIQGDSEFNGSGQKLEFSTNAYTIQAIASVNLKLIEFYGALGYNTAKMDVNIKGTYELEYTEVNSGLTVVSETLIDPVSVEFDASGVRATVGTRLNLGFFKIFADYTMQEYNTITGGIAFSFR